MSSLLSFQVDRGEVVCLELGEALGSEYQLKLRPAWLATARARCTRVCG